MSHSTGVVRLVTDGSIVGYFEYDGTTDIALRAVRATPEDVDINWRSPEADRACSCDSQAEATVDLDDDVDDGIRWRSRVCLRCMTITGDRSPWAET